MSSTAEAVSWPEIRVTYWKLEIEAAPLPPRDLAQIGGRGAIFAAEAEALDQSRQDQQAGRQPAGLLVARRGGDQQRAEAHQADRKTEACLAPFMIGIDAHDPGADRAHQEAGPEYQGGTGLLRHRIALGKEGRREIEREGGVDIPIVPLDHVPGRTADDVADAMAVRVRHAAHPVTQVSADPSSNRSTPIASEISLSPPTSRTSSTGGRRKPS